MILGTDYVKLNTSEYFYGDDLDLEKYKWTQTIFLT